MSTRLYFARMCLVVISFMYFLIFSGCKVGPDYVRPEASVPDQWHEKAVQGLEDGSANLQTWWTVFDDPILEGLIQRSRAENLDLQIAYFRIMESRALLGVASGEYWPNVDGTGFYSRSRPSENGLIAPFMGGSDQTNLHSVGVDASWEIDVFGRIGRSVESAQASMQASVEDYRDVLVSLYSDVAQTYITLRSLQTRIQYAQGNIKLQSDTLELTRNRREVELAPELDVQQAELVLATTQSLLPRLRQLESRSVHRLSVLLGQPPTALYEQLSDATGIPKVPEQVAAALPAELLRQRPDIRRAERILAAQTAQVGVATAGLYPVFSLSGTFALQSQQISDVGDWGSRAWGFGPAMRWNIFDGNRARSSIKVQEARTEQALADYEKTVLLALEEVENAMVAYAREQERLKALEKSVRAARKSVELVKSSYEIGLTDFQNVLDMQRSLVDQEDEMATSRGLVAKALARIYTTLGGGWSVDATQTEVPESAQQTSNTEQ